MRSPRRTLCLTVLALGLLGLPAPAAFENGAADLVGSTWQGEASLRLALHSSVANGGERLPPADITITFPTASRFEVSSDTLGSVAGDWKVRRHSKRQLVGAPDDEVLQAEAAALQILLEGLVREETGRNFTVTVKPRSGKLKGRLNHAGDEITASLKYRFSGRMRLGRRRASFRVTESAKVHAVPEPV